MRIDLQHHSTYSDGQLTPTGVANFAYSNGVKIASLTDHNTVAGLDEFKKACKKRRMKSIVGLELYVKLGHKRFNLLWYNFDDASPELHALLRQTQIRRRASVRRILCKVIEKKGIELNVEKVLDSHNHYIPINGIVYEMWKSKKNQKIFENDLEIKNPREEDIMMEYLKNKKYGVLNESYVNINRIIKLRKKIGGQLIINHPGKNGHLKREQFEHLKKMGIDGIEVLSPHHSLGAVMYFQYLSNELDFIETGGSDFHIFEGGRAKIQNSWNYFQIESKYLRKIDRIIGK
ncbi:MAG: PHP domain-containing protein [Patescibacteria group bacterium]|jgi:predicted metal-dependent phosphoesterase TrpH|nr:PHP domain-containing protein [Patescibacteria group bacterium]